MRKAPSPKYTNFLSKESSPYLLQHAHNPVNWYAWGTEALQLAKKQNKPLIISIGYSACHWCHVMERESFEDEEVAEFMNQYFVCIKVDREERPDIDQIYMNAVQLMSGGGGWPLNCFATPDGRPFYGGTYFPKSQWLDVLQQLHEVYINDLGKVERYANQLTEGVQQSELIKKEYHSKKFNLKKLQKGIYKWAEYFDTLDGGEKKAPKFPMPNNYEFLLHYYYFSKDKKILDHIELSLQKMAYGGIYDQIGGGFARYSIDNKWKVPHFEKMLYDNAQLVSIYSNTYKLTKNPLYKKIVYQSLEFIKREMTAGNGSFYSAIDADSEGIEGKYYVWNKEELKEIIKEDFKLFQEYYNINENGYWEEGNYILLRDKSDKEFAREQHVDLNYLQDKVGKWEKALMTQRQERIKPSLDDKCLCSWNALMLKAYVDAYTAFNEDEFLEAAINNANFIVETLKDGNRLFHSYKNGKPSINAFLEDYALTIEALITLYQASFNESWLQHAKDLADFSILHFYNEKNGMFYFNSDEDPALIARKTEVSDNVMPASNSSMGKAIFLLGKCFDNVVYKNIALQMMRNMEEQLLTYTQAYTNWGILYLHYLLPFYEVAIVGDKSIEKAKELFKSYLPNILILGGTFDAELALLKDKYIEGQTTMYVCKNNVCQMPVTKVQEAKKQILSH